MTEQLTNTPLWPHQLEDVDKLDEEPRVLVANEPGTGKTLLAVERDLRLRRDAYEGPTLVVAPLSTHQTWAETYRRETDLKVKRINRKDRESFIDDYADVYIMHYEALRLMPWLQDEIKFGHGIFDECHKLKSRTTQQTKAAKKIKIPYLTDMSGSPVTDHPQDIWSILNHLKPKDYRSFWKFFHENVEYINEWDAKSGRKFRKIIGPAPQWQREGLPRIEPFFVRRLKLDVLKDLPPKLSSRVYVDLAPPQRRIYNEMRDDMITWINTVDNIEEPFVASAAIAKLQRLQMIAIGTPIFGEEVVKKNKSGEETVFRPIKLVDPSPKVDAVMELLNDQPCEQFVIFSQFKGPLRILKERFAKEGISYGSFTGDDPQQFRDIYKREFIEGKRRVLLGTISAGGVGVDGLQHACANVIFIDRHWSPAINEQAEDRLHRGGQLRSVHVIDIMANDTVDFSRMETIATKAQWIKFMMGDK